MTTDAIRPFGTTTPRRSRGPDLAKVLAGALIGLIAAAVAILGGAVLNADAKRDASGFLTTERHVYESEPTSRALVTDVMDLDLDSAEWLVDSTDLGTLRFELEGANGKPVFAGIAPTSQVERYLDGVATTTLSDVDFEPFAPQYASTFGTAEPGEEPRWAATTDRNGTLSWKIEEGDWSVVVTNRDGSSGVAVNATAGADVPLLDEVGWTLLIAGGIGLLAATALVASGARRRRGEA